MDEALVEITNLIYGGNGMGRLADGRAVFVPFTLPGEKVRIRLVEQKPSFARGYLLEVLKPAANRIPPRCPHFIQCGGCHYQHMAYEDQLVTKKQIVEEQIHRLAGVAEPVVREIIPSPSPWNYRNTVQFHLDPQGRIGYQRPLSHQVLPITECHLPVDGLNQVWPQLSFEPGLGLERLELRQSSDEEILMVMEGEPRDLPEVNLEAPISIVHESDGEQVVVAGLEYLFMDVNKRGFMVSAGSFFQVNLAQAEQMVKLVLDALQLKPAQTVMDLYAGVGLFSAFIAPSVKRLVAVEVSESACKDFAYNLDEFENVELYVGLTEEVLPSLEIKPDAVVLDPPRAGLEKLAMEALLNMKPKRIVYVSCDPSTLARDAKRLIAGGYNLEYTTPVDMFPQTFHIESV
ncbi:MAG TPA: class I SAM-dependent RNA methyltransferase, partial [Longilinea sp.]|nr:class I SAM-dependent RNA methyltransferase [Longilinea sp.]